MNRREMLVPELIDPSFAAHMRVYRAAIRGAGHNCLRLPQGRMGKYGLARAVAD